MRFSLSLIALIAALVFGMLTVADGMQTARAGDDDDVVPIGRCGNDDGDDDLPPNEEPVDDPDSEDSEKGPEVGDPEDEDPYYEPDDCPTPGVPPLAAQECGDMTGSGIYLFSDPNYGGLCVRFIFDSVFVDFDTCNIQSMPCWNDITSSIKLIGVPYGGYVCLHSFYQGNCELITSDVPNAQTLPNQDCSPTPTPACSLDENISSLYFNFSPPSVPDGDGPEASFAAADADCDGGVAVSDALTNLQYLSGFEAGCAGDWNGDSYQGDADCSGAIGAGDVTAILAVVATGSESAC